MFKNRSTIDVVVILLSTTIGSVMMLAIIGVIVLKVVRPEVDTSKAGEAITLNVTTIVGALVGFIGGRATGRMEANGNAK